MPVTYIPQDTPPDPSTSGGVTYTAPPGMGPQPGVNPYDLLSTTPPTWGETAKHAGEAVASGALYGLTTPTDLPGNLYNLGAYGWNRYAGGDLPFVSTPGQRLQEHLGIDQPVTTGEQILSGAAQLPISAMWGPAATGGRFATALRAAPTNIVLGAGQGGMQAMDLPPEAQLPIMAAAGLIAGARIPGLKTTASPRNLELADELRGERVPVNPVDLGPTGAYTTYTRTSVLPATGAAGFAENQYKAWTDAVARRVGGIGATTDEDGVFTPQMLQAANTRINGDYNLAGAVRNMPFSPFTTGNNLYARLTTIAQDAINRGTPQSVPAQGVVNFVNGLKNFANNQGGELTADQIIRELQTNSPLAGHMNDPNNASMNEFYGKIRQAIQDEFRTHLATYSPDSLAAYDRANNSYRSLNTVSDALNAGNGRLTPQNLAAAAANSPYEGSGPGSMANLAQAGVQFVTPVQPRPPVAQAVLAKQQGTIGTLRELGLAGIGLHELQDVAGAIPGGKGAAATVAAASYPYIVGQTRAARAMPLAPPSPTSGQYYAGMLRYGAIPGRAQQPDPNAPLLPVFGGT